MTPTQLLFSVFLLLLELAGLRAKDFTIGYLTNIHGRQNMARQGYIISGAIAYAVDRVNQENSSLLSGHTLHMIYNDTQGDRLLGTKAVIDQYNAGAVAIFGPEDSCDVEATVATALNVPMISYKCADSKVSKKEFFTSFARTQPPDTRIVRSVISLLTYYRWFKFSIISERGPQYQMVAETLESEAVSSGNFSINSQVTFEGSISCCEKFLGCCNEGFPTIVDETYKTTRVYVFIGSEMDLIKLMTALRNKGLLESGDYMVLHIDLETYAVSQSFKYFWSSRMPEGYIPIALETVRSLLTIVPSPPQGRNYSDFVEKVREYNQKLPFNFTDPFPSSVAT